MSENVNEILGIMPQDEVVQKASVKGEKATNNSAENTLITIANIVLVLGILATFICIITIVFVKNSEYETKHIFNPSGFVITLMVLFSSLISWGFLKVLANISLTLKDMNSKIK